MCFQYHVVWIEWSDILPLICLSACFSDATFEKCDLHWSLFAHARGILFKTRLFRMSSQEALRHRRGHHPRCSKNTSSPPDSFLSAKTNGDPRRIFFFRNTSSFLLVFMFLTFCRVSLSYCLCAWLCRLARVCLHLCLHTGICFYFWLPYFPCASSFIYPCVSDCIFCFV